MPPAAARPSVRYRSVIVVLILAFALLGFFALGRLPVDLPASPWMPQLHVRITTPGLTSPAIEEQLTRRFESALAGIPGVADMDSVTLAGGATIVLTPVSRRDVEAVQRAAASRLENAGLALPASLDPPVLTLTDAASTSVEFSLASATHDSLALRDWAEAEFAKRLRELDGVDSVDVRGGTVREISVLPDQRRLAGYGLSFEDLLQAVRRNPEARPQQRQSPVPPRSRREPVQTGDLAAVAAVPVPLPGGESVRLSEVARLALQHEPDSAAAGADSRGSVRVTVHKQAPAALSDVVERVRAHVDWMRANRLIPEGIELHDLSGRYDEARQLLRKSAYAFLAGLVLMMIAVHLIWGIARRALIFGVIVAVSLQGVFMAMAVTGMALDVITLGGLALCAGLIGGSVLRMFEREARPAPALSRDFSRFAAPSLIVIAAFIPVVLDGGELGVFARKLAPVLGGAWLLAAGLAWWLVPIFDARRSSRSVAPWHAVLGHALARLRQAYDGTLRRMLRRPALPLAATIAVFLPAAVLLSSAGQAPQPATPAGADIVLRASGPDYAGVVAIADGIVHSLEEISGIRHASHDGQAAREEWSLQLDEDRARELGVDIVMAGKALAMATTGITAGSFRDAEHQYNVRMRLPPEDAGSVATGKILLLGELEDRPAVHLRDVAALVRVPVPSRLQRHNGSPVVEIRARADNGTLPEPALEKIRALTGKPGIPPGYRISFGRHAGAPDGFRDMITPGLSVLMTAAVAMLLYRSAPLALVILVSACATLVITAAGARLFGLALSPPAWLAMVLLLGLSAGHAALLASPAPAPGSILLIRVRQACRRRFRLMFATVITGILGMLSLTLINGSIPELHIIISILAPGLGVSLLVNLLLAPLLLNRLLAPKEQIPVS